ncbi:hypothetical protein MTO98_19110 [Mucilaginibacter sp. SMC90]|uniref:alpha-L-rhamnosidase-related protein n=1 Tax=Mucilaginibacter sp. SMC90 TaxID=2929803 RepID=UPI001FB342E9|nr:hypothetical protein [Mucilaginibacter sp. SMC90]UOE46514.1 hypothetical protein MTO98_19110 [Mucilaginibacter sp. SMC90]
MSRLISIVLILFLLPIVSFANTGTGLTHNLAAKTITITVPDKKLSITIDYSAGCMIKRLDINGHNTLSANGIQTGIQTKNGEYLSVRSKAVLTVTEGAGHFIIKGITYGDDVVKIAETWDFELKNGKILWSITRDYSNSAVLEDMAFPKWNFADLSVWKGGILDNGGMVWCKYLKQINDTYGVHTGGVTFWNAQSGDGLRITPTSKAGNSVASKYSHSNKNEFTCAQIISDSTLGQRYNLSRFVSKKADVFAPVEIKKGKVSVQYELQYVDYFAKYSRGTLNGIDALSVRELLNTTGRYGVVDNNIVGGNGWLTNWKCMHEPFFAQIGMALNDKNYTRNFSATLDQERDQAMLPDGRVLSRWHNVPGDEIPGTYNTQTGYYEAMWGYTVDSQTGYVINASEQFDLNGDIKWLKSHQESCERALAWLIKRDSNNNGIFEMVNNNVAEKKASDWLDIVWASYENAFVNAQMYEALKLWADCEKTLNNPEKSAYYHSVAERLKAAFNKPVEQGGFWSADKKQYVYWRDNDGSVHGDNLVTPVNFAAIAFGLCDDKTRIAQILGQIEQRTTNEHLFHWPLCFDSFKREEVSDGNWPFPKYENGDIFPTWGYLGVRAYTAYNKDIALKYVRNILAQYQKDGLSSQRYSRVTQHGLGEDILAGICTTITGLYRDIYGIRPKWNRMGLEPNMTEALNGTQFSYTLRDIVYQLKLNVNDYTIHTNTFSVNSKESFGVSGGRHKLTYYHNNQDTASLQIQSASAKPVKINVNSWNYDAISWTMLSKDTYNFTITGLDAGSVYQLLINNTIQHIKADSDGRVTLKKACNGTLNFQVKKSV